MKGFVKKETSPFLVLLLLIAFVIGGAFVATFIYAVLGDMLFGVGMFELERALKNPTEFPQGRSAIMFYQGIVSLCMFVFAPLLLIQSLGYNLGRYLNWKDRPMLGLVLLSGLLIIAIMPANSLIIYWNANMSLPDFMQQFEDWARQKEEYAAELTKLFAKFTTIPELLVGLLVIAVIPAIGEELLFRGVVQRQIQRWSGNGHVGIWVAAIAFSAIHVQFFGFVPRMVLGALFGYLYWWSGRISVPIVAHFVNNGFTVLLLYLYQTGSIEADIESSEPMPVYSVVMSVVLSAGLLYYLYKEFMKLPLLQKQEAEPESTNNFTDAPNLPGRTDGL
ncbi:lysostaphin resistance A-like protein [Pontibacter sp. 13R65]|uniref:CPBP family intramembrane glutamic endopeptidase n=1 Tax=Pontibacter sp. 13R65 TaxID=3127458 RepID=UPI00301C92F2